MFLIIESLHLAILTFFYSFRIAQQTRKKVRIVRKSPSSRSYWIYQCVSFLNSLKRLDCSLAFSPENEHVKISLIYKIPAQGKKTRLSCVSSVLKNVAATM